MVEHHPVTACCAHGAALQDADDLCLRIEAEFREMPGLSLTLAQAARLFGAHPARCERVLDALVHAGELATDGHIFRTRSERY
jgi:hypothetical protein